MGKGPPPIVTGISPAEGPPGTLVKIRGENLGSCANDVLRIFICNVNCTYSAEWQHSRLIHVRTGLGLGMGDIIVFTTSGEGTSMVKFRGYMPRVGLLTEAAVWVDESKLFEKKPSSNLSNSRMYAHNLSTYTDPLGVAPEETGAVLPADQIEEWYKGTSSNPLSENFNPSRFLLERHLDTSFDALKSGYYHLQSQDTRTSVGPTSFVRGNLTTILNSLSSLNEIQKLLADHESESVGGDICEEMECILKSCNGASNSLFKDILARKDEADVKRNVLNVLHRYRFLFNLPRSIEKNIQQGEYEILISDFNRAKALFHNTQVESFQKALLQVEHKISAFSDQLKKKLFDFPTPLEDQKKMIRYLNDLDYSGCAGWECIMKQAQWIKTMLVDCKVRYLSQEDVDEKKVHSASTLEYKSNFHNTPMPQVSLGLTMVQELCKLMSEHLTDLWNLGQTYLSNQLGDRRDPVEKSESARDKFLDLIKDVVVVFCEITNSILHPFEKDHLSIEENPKYDELVSWLPYGVKAFKSVLERLDNLGLTDDAISMLKSLSARSVGDCINKVLLNAVKEIQKLPNEERWELNHSQKVYCTSKLPDKFEKIFSDTLKFVHDFMTDSKLDSKNDTVPRKEIVPLLEKMMEEFLMALEKTVYFDIKKGNLTFADKSVEVCTSKDMQVLILLSNCYHLKEVVVPRIIDHCEKFGYEELKDFHAEISDSISKLDERVFNTYIEMKGEPIVGGIEIGINMGEYRWDGLEGGNNVRQYVKDILMKLIVIHNQVSSISSLFIDRTFTVLVELISDELQRLYECIDSFSRAGALQASLELNVLKSSLDVYMSDKAKLNFARAFDFIPSLESNDEKMIKSALASYKSSMHYQISSFSTGNHDIFITHSK